MFLFGEIPDDMNYFANVLESELVYSTSMLGDAGDTEYEKELWQSKVSQVTAQLGDIGIPNLNDMTGSGYSLAGFNFGSNWPVIAIVGVGLLVVMRKGPPEHAPAKRRKVHVQPRRKR